MRRVRRVRRVRGVVHWQEMLERRHAELLFAEEVRRGVVAGGTAVARRGIAANVGFSVGVAAVPVGDGVE